MLNTLVATLTGSSAVDTISRWRAKPDELVFDSSETDIKQFFQAIDTLQQSPHEKRSSELIPIAMDRLRKEFQAVLSRQADYPASPHSPNVESSTVTDSTAFTFMYEDYTAEIPNKDGIIYLRSIAERMNSDGNLLECVGIYKGVRKKLLQSQFRRLHFNELEIGDNLKRFDWNDLKVKIGLWIQVSEIINKIFEKEKELCGEIFEGLGENSVKDECFVGTVQEFANVLFGFARAVSESNQPYQQIGEVFGLYGAFWSILPTVRSLFGSDRIRNSCEETLGRIESETGRMLYDLENVVVNEISNFRDDTGRVCRMTEIVMVQVEHIANHREMLTDLIKAAPLLNFNGSTIRREDLGDTSNRSFLHLHLMLIIAVLRRNLEGKLKHYENTCLGHLFMMNNVHYVVQKIEGSNDLKEMIGDSEFKKLNESVELEMNSYVKLTCDKFFFACFDDEGPDDVTRCFKCGPSKNALKKRLMSFNALFDEIERVQSSWTVPDSQLRERIYLSLSQQLVPAYSNFLGKLGRIPETRTNIKHTVSDLMNLVHRLLANRID